MEGRKMPAAAIQGESPCIIAHEDFQQLLDVLAQQGYRVVGPTLRENVIVYDDLSSNEQLPVDYKDSQDGGTYRLKKTKEPCFFGYTLFGYAANVGSRCDESADYWLVQPAIRFEV